MNYPESAHQQAVFQWAAKTRLSELKHPVIPGAYVTDYLNATANFGVIKKSAAARIKREGLKAGFPDINLTLPCSGYHGLFIELKNDKPKGKLSQAQKSWLSKLNKAGYLALACYGVDETIDAIRAYLKDNQQICEALKYAH